MGPDRPLGERPGDFSEPHVHPNPGADRRDVSLDGRHGGDFGVITVGGRVVACSAEPLFLVPALGFERAARVAVHALFSGVAVSGLVPTHLSIDFNLPPEITDTEFETVWTTMDREARALGVSVVTGHTARYAGCAYPVVGGGTTLAVGDPAELVRPDGARVGDHVVVTKGPAVAATGLLAGEFPGDEVAPERLDDTSVVRDALVATAAGPVTAMHAVGERGLYGGLADLAASAGVGVELDRARVPVAPGVRETCERFGIDPWTALGHGCLLATVASERTDAVLAALDDEGIRAAAAGRVTDGEGLVVDGEPVERPTSDPYWWAVEGRREQREGTSE